MNQITLLDGGMGKELRRIGAPFRQPEWSALALLEAPEFVVQAHTNFIDAGAQIITTSNYAVVPYHLGAETIAERGNELVALSGRLARQAVSATRPSVNVAGSLPPLFGSYEPNLFDPVRAPALYRMIVDALDPNVDLWRSETLSSTAELDSVAEAVASRGSGKPLWVGFTLPEHQTDGEITLHSGETMRQLVDAIDAHGELVEAVLFNCASPEQIGAALRAVGTELAATDLELPIGGYANAFPPTRHEGYAANETIFEPRTDLTAERYADVVGEWIDAGATIIGGCCDVYPEHITELATRFL